jgi:hypothetical protein
LAQVKRPEDIKHPINPIRRSDYTIAQVLALRALQGGTATAEQQKEVLRFIVYDCCRTYDTAWRVDQRETDILIGRIAVGQDIIHYLNAADLNADMDKVSVRTHFEQLGERSDERADENTDQP